MQEVDNRAGVSPASSNNPDQFVNTVREIIGGVDLAHASVVLARLVLSALLAGPSSLPAQLVPDGGTRTLASVTNTIIGTVTVGTNGMFTILQLSDNALLTNSAHGVIGRNASALFNEVRLTSATARWRMGANLYLGSDGAASRLVLSNDGRVESRISHIGYFSTIATGLDPFIDPPTFELNGGTLITRGAVISNAVPFIVGGSGGIAAVWKALGGASDNFVARNLLVGGNSSFNQLVIPNGVVSAGSNVIVGASPLISTNNLLHVTGISQRFYRLRTP